MARISLNFLAFSFLATITMIGAGCGYGSHNYMNGTGMPKVAQLSPNSVPQGSAPFTMTIEGSGFGSDSLVYWAGASRATNYGSASQVSVNVTADDIANPGMVQVYVHSGGTNSNAMT